MKIIPEYTHQHCVQHTLHTSPLIGEVGSGSDATGFAETFRGAVALFSAKLPRLALLATLLVNALPAPVTAQPAADALALVDPFIGVDRGGNVFPGAALPFSLVSVSPNIDVPQSTSGYLSKRPILGFAHNHSSGTGGTGRYGNLLVTPQTGPLQLGVASPLAEEKASPGYYSAKLADSGILAEVTLSERVGVHRYTFPAGSPARILFDVSATRNTNKPEEKPSSTCLAATARVVGDRTLEGEAKFQGDWGGGKPYSVFFVAQFDRPFATSGGWQGQQILPGATSVTGTVSGLYAEFNLPAGQSLGLQVGVSYLSVEKARQNLAETQAQSFEQVRTRAASVWRGYLDRIVVEGGTPAQRTAFHTGIYRSFVMPNDVTGDVPGWDPAVPHFWNYYCIWDTYLTLHPLYTLIAPDKQTAIVRNLIDISQKTGWVPDAWLAGDFGNIQGGTHGDMLLAEAFIKNLPGFDREAAYTALRKSATEPGDGLKKGKFADYFKLGYLPTPSDPGNVRMDTNSNPTSRTLEYSRNDFAVATVARLLGKKDDAERFTKQSLNGWQLWNPATRFFWGKDANGQWMPGYFKNRDYITSGFDPAAHPAPWRPPFYEGSAWHYAFSMQHDVAGLIARHGGEDALFAFLERYFDEKLPGAKRAGYHDQGNEPVFLNPWLYTYLGRPDKNVDRVRAIMERDYGTGRAGLPGNDDAGAMSSWYAFASLGFFPVAGQDVYLLASPVFTRSTLRLAGGKQFVIQANNLTAENRYVQSANLNGKPWEKAWFQHQDIINGAVLVLEMGPKPSTWGTKAPHPPSASDLIPEFARQLQETQTPPGIEPAAPLPVKN